MKRSSDQLVIPSVEFLLLSEGVDIPLEHLPAGRTPVVAIKMVRKLCSASITGRHIQ